MKFGIWDHIDRSALPLAEQLSLRLDFLKAADKAGYYSFHVAEHHATPLNMVPVPGVFLGAVARATKRIRLGPLTYLLPLYAPLRLIEEISILDHLSGGRLDLGIGRGVSPFEMNYHNVDQETSIAVFNEVLEIVLKGFGADRLSHKGQYFTYREVPMELRPLQSPHPPIWYPSSSAFGANLAGERGYNFVTLGSLDMTRRNVATFREALAAGGGADVTAEGFKEGVAIGVLRYAVIAETNQDAMAAARPAYAAWYDNLTKLRRENTKGSSIDAHVPQDIEAAVAAGAAVVGTPNRVAAELAAQIEQTGVNYMIMGFYMGTMAHEHALRSLHLFAEEVMPSLT
jgi:luciferase family oxidoreductase group 1